MGPLPSEEPQRQDQNKIGLRVEKQNSYLHLKKPEQGLLGISLVHEIENLNASKPISAISLTSSCTSQNKLNLITCSTSKKQSKPKKRERDLVFMIPITSYISITNTICKFFNQIL